VSKSEQGGGRKPPTRTSEVPSPDEARDWLKKHLASAPKRSEQWRREVLDIYRLGRRERAEALAAEDGTG